MHTHEHHRAHDKHAGHSAQMFARKFWVSLVLTLPVVLVSPLAERLAGRELLAPPLGGLLSLVLGTAVFAYGGWVFLVGAGRELRGRSPGMMTLIALAISTAYAYSVVAVLTRRGEPLFWELTTLITVMLLGHWLEMRAVRGASGALRELSKLLPDTAEVIRDGETRVVPLGELRVSDLVLVRPGGKIPADGVVAEGSSDVNEALVTGESAPVAKRPGRAVIAGTVNGDGVLRVRVARIGEETFLAGIRRLVAEAQASKSRLQLLADRAAFLLTIVAVASGAATLVAWLAVGDSVGTAVERTVAVLVIVCPHALGVAIPLVATISTALAARQGVLIRRRLALEAARAVSVVLFDKTGTLTKGEFGVERVLPVAGQAPEEVLRVAASLEASSEHVVAKAIVAHALHHGLPLQPVVEARAVPGVGMCGVLDGAAVAAGGAALLAGQSLPGEITATVADEQRKGRTVVYVQRGGRLLGALSLGDVVREESNAAVAALSRLGVRVAMVTGDTDEVARAVAATLSIREVYARVRPAGKAEVVKRLQEEGVKVAFVGDGINDAPALAQADVGIAIGAGTNVAIESAGILLVRNDPRGVPTVLALARATVRKMRENLVWATGYNVVALPLAAGVLASRGIVLEPAVSALLMSLSTVVVALNALLLRHATLFPRSQGSAAVC